MLNREDGYHYAMMRAEKYRDQQYGTCLMRTKNLSDPSSWRAWGGSQFNVRFADPYTANDLDARDHVCRPVSPNQIGAMVESLTFNEYFGKWLLVGASQDTIDGRQVVGFYYSLSDDLIELVAAQADPARSELAWSYKCGESQPGRAIHPCSIPSRRRGTSTRPAAPATCSSPASTTSNCQQNLNRDMVRVPIRFSK